MLAADPHLTGEFRGRHPLRDAPEDQEDLAGAEVCTLSTGLIAFRGQTGWLALKDLGESQEPYSRPSQWHRGPAVRTSPRHGGLP
jgi:hypothetical protein